MRNIISMSKIFIDRNFWVKTSTILFTYHRVFILSNFSLPIHSCTHPLIYLFIHYYGTTITSLFKKYILLKLFTFVFSLLILGCWYCISLQMKKFSCHSQCLSDRNIQYIFCPKNKRWRVCINFNRKKLV